MSYILSIGEFTAKTFPEDRDVGAGVIEDYHDEAPVNSSNNKSNEILPSYVGWAEFCRDVGLYNVFFAGRPNVDWWKDSDGDENEGIIQEHPGAVKLTEEHLKKFKQAKQSYLARPEPRSGYSEEDGVDWNLRRLNWLVYWTEYSLLNHEYPTFANY